MKLPCDFFRLPAARQWLFRARRQPVKRTITVPAPLAASDGVRVVHPHVSAMRASNDAVAHSRPLRVANA